MVEFPCDDSSNTTYQSAAMEMLLNLQTGSWLLFVISLIGVINNLILLTIAYRLQWFRQPHYVLILHQSFIDMLNAILMTIEGIYPLIYYYTGTPNILSQAVCTGLYVPFQIAQDLGQRTSLMVAIDRLVNAIVPFRWAALGYRYRLVMLGIAWTWSIIEETTYLAFVKDVCLTVCYSEFSYPSSWWDWVATASDTFASAAIIIAYIALPPLSGKVLSRLNCSTLVVAIDNMEQRQQEMVRRVRRLSVLTIISYVCTTFVSFTWCDITQSVGKSMTLYQMAFMYPFAAVMSALNTVLPLFLFIWREPSVRQQLSQLVGYRQK